MMVLWDKDNLRVGSIAQKLNLESATLTLMLKRLELAGFLAHKRNLKDERVVEITLTNVCIALKEQAAKVQNGVVRQTGLSSEDFNHLCSSLKKLVQNMATKHE